MLQGAQTPLAKEKRDFDKRTAWALSQALRRAGKTTQRIFLFHSHRARLQQGAEYGTMRINKTVK